MLLAEAGRVGAESSWAGAGMLAPGGEFRDANTWAHRAVESSNAYSEWVAELTRETGVPIDYRACGALEFPESSADWPQLLARSNRQSEFGVLSDAGDGFVYYPQDAIVDPREVIAALTISMRARGVTVMEGARVEKLRADGVELGDRRRLESRFVVVAAGAWSRELSDANAPDVFPVKGHLIGYQLQPGTFPQIQRRGHFYVLQRSNGFTIGGSTTEHVGFDRTVEASTVERLAKEMRNFIPDLPERPDEAWIGFRPGSNGDPVVGRWRDSHVWHAYAHYRNGILLAPLTARLVAAEIAAALRD